MITIGPINVMEKTVFTNANTFTKEVKSVSASCHCTNHTISGNKINYMIKTPPYEKGVIADIGYMVLNSYLTVTFTDLTTEIVKVTLNVLPNLN